MSTAAHPSMILDHEVKPHDEVEVRHNNREKTRDEGNFKGEEFYDRDEQKIRRVSRGQHRFRLPGEKLKGFK